MGEAMSTDVVLAEIKGDVKRIFDRFEQYAKDSERRDRDQANFSANVNTRLNAHSERIRSLELTNTNQVGERAGVGKAFKWAYMAAGGGIGTLLLGALAIFARAMGVQ